MKQTQWEKAHDKLMDLYRLCAREAEQGYDRPETREAIDRAERAEQEAWIAMRGNSGLNRK